MHPPDPWTSNPILPIPLPELISMLSCHSLRGPKREISDLPLKGPSTVGPDVVLLGNSHSVAGLSEGPELFS